MKGLLVSGDVAEVINLSIFKGKYLCDGIEYIKVKIDENGIFAKSSIEENSVVYGLKSEFVKENYPQHYMGKDKYNKSSPDIVDGWGKIINEVLSYQYMNQMELSKKTGISEAHITSLKKGKRKEPSFEKGLALIKLHPNTEELLGL